MPEEEIESCVHYEYARESEAIVHEVSQLKQAIRRETERLGTKPGRMAAGMILRFRKVMGQRRGGIYEGTFFSLLACSEGFPEMPWQKLSDSDKHCLRDFVGFARRSDPHSLRAKEFPPVLIDTLSKDPTMGQLTLSTWKRAKLAGYKKVPVGRARDVFQTENIAPALSRSFVHGFIQINIGWGHAQILDALSKWLRQNHAESEAKPIRLGRKGRRDALNALGALRLHYYCKSFSAAKKLMGPLKKKGNSLYYEHRESFNRACNAAVQHFRNLLFLSKPDLPIHFRKAEPK